MNRLNMNRLLFLFIIFLGVLNAQYSPPSGGGGGAGVLLSNTVTILPAQMLTLNSVPVTLLPALGQKILTYPVRILVEQANAYWSSDDQVMLIGYGTFESNTEIGLLGFLTGSENAIQINTYFLAGTFNGPSTDYVNLPLIGYADESVTQPDGTGGNVYITVWYIAVTLS